MPEYASQQGPDFKNRLENIAIVGAGGRSGGFMVKSLVATGKHKVTAISRPDSTSKMPAGLHAVKHVNYDSRLSIVEALRGQDVLIITVSVMAPPETQKTLIDAAIEAGVKYIIPNEWGVDHTNKEVARDTILGERIQGIRDHIVEKSEGKTSFIGFVCGFWYEFSLAGTEVRYGFDFDKKEVTFYDDGKVKMNTSTFPQLGRGIAAVLSLPLLPEDENDKSPTISRWKNGTVNISSFFVNQRDMFDSVLRVTGDKESDWKISYEDVRERYARGKADMQKGNMRGFGMMLYARLFFPDGAADYNSRLDNKVLGLPEESLDEFTKLAVEMAARGETNMIPG
jgi:hypothetical protein